MPSLSIIVPVYNKEPYIDACIKSILAQTFTDFELILVNDGSTDKSGLRCEEYKKADSRIIFIEQENAGVSAARNAGLEKATGEYIGFVDADDEIEPDMYETLINNIRDFQADISVCRMRVIYPNKTINPSDRYSAPVKLNNTDALTRYLNEDLDLSANNKIYKAAILKGIKFKGVINEDVLYACKAFLAAESTVYQNVPKYNYIIRDSSSTMTKFGEKYMQIVDISKEIVQLVIDRNPECTDIAKAFDLSANLSVLNLLLLSNRSKYADYYERITNTLNTYKYFVSTSKDVRIKHKYAYRLFIFSPGFYKSAMYLYCKITNAAVITRT